MSTNFATLSDAQKRIWSADLWMQARLKDFWESNGFMSSGDSDTSRPVQKITKLSKTERGRECVMQLVLDMQGDGVVGDNEMYGNEEDLVNDLITIRTDQIRHAVKSKGEMTEQGSVIHFTATAKNALSYRQASQLDELKFLTASGRSYELKLDGSTRGASQLPSLAFASDVTAASSGRILYAGSAVSEATLTAADKMSWNFLVSASTMANRKLIPPIRQGGKDYWVVVMSPEQRRDLVTDSTYQTIVSRAGVKGTSNPLFTNAMAVVDNLILYDHHRVFTTQGLTSGNRWGSGGTVHGAQALLLGAQALGFAMTENTFVRESDRTDYDNQKGILFGSKFGLIKPVFKSLQDNSTRQDFAVLSLKTAAAA